MPSLSLPPLVEIKVSDRILVDIAYSQQNHPDNAFGALYTNQAKMLLHPTLASIVMTALKFIPDGDKLSVKDGLRTVDAQEGMVRVKDEHEWPDSLVSSPGQGGHPRGCAVDIMRVDNDGIEVDVGTRFDDFKQINTNGQVLPEDEFGLPRASRDNPFLTDSQRTNQQLLEIAVIRAGLEHETLVMALPQEHWDFRFPETLSDLSHILDSISRILKLEKPTDTGKDISSYDEFVKVWNERFSPHRSDLESIIGQFDPPSEQTVIFSSSYRPITDLELVEMGWPAMTGNDN